MSDRSGNARRQESTDTAPERPERTLKYLHQGACI